MKYTKFSLYTLFVLLATLAALVTYRTVEQRTPLQTEISPVLSPGHQQEPSLKVTHQLVGRDLHLQLKVTGFTFSLENMGKENHEGEGHAHLYVDGKKVMKLFGSTSIWKDMKPGLHKVAIELAHNNHDPYGIKQEFEVEVK